MKIGEAARKLGVATHVLRHWEEVGVVVPRRAASGHRHYDEEHLTRARVLQSCQRIGLSLAEIRQVLDRSQAGRTAVIEDRLRAIRRQQQHLRAAATFLQPVIDCRHDMLVRCPECSEFASASTSAGTQS